jgi:hypothetical protein
LRRDIPKNYLPPNTVPKENLNYIFIALPQQKMDDRAARKFVAGLLEKDRPWPECKMPDSKSAAARPSRDPDYG